MGQIKNLLKISLHAIYSDLDPGRTAEQKANAIAAAIENAILNGLEVKVPSGRVVIAAKDAVMNPGPIDCDLES